MLSIQLPTKRLLKFSSWCQKITQIFQQPLTEPLKFSRPHSPKSIYHRFTKSLKFSIGVRKNLKFSIDSKNFSNFPAGVRKLLKFSSHVATSE